MTPSDALKSLVESHERLVTELIAAVARDAQNYEFAAIERSTSATCLAIEEVCKLISSAAPHFTAESPEGLDSVSEAAEFTETARHAEPSGGTPRDWRVRVETGATGYNKTGLTRDEAEDHYRIECDAHPSATVALYLRDLIVKVRPRPQSPPPATHDDTTNPETVGEEEGGGETDDGPGGGGAPMCTSGYMQENRPEIPDTAYRDYAWDKPLRHPCNFNGCDEIFDTEEEAVAHRNQEHYA